MEDYNRNLEERVIERTEEIEERNRELEGLDDIVRNINNEVELGNLLYSLLDETMQLFPEAERGAFLVLDHYRDLFHFGAVSGYDDNKGRNTWLSLQEIATWFGTDVDGMTPGIHRFTDFSMANRKTLESFFPLPKASLVMTVSLQDEVEGFLILDNLTREDVFGEEEQQRLLRLKGHAVSAVVKARTLEEDRHKNQELVKAQRQLVMQEKMAYLGNLTSGIAHEIRNPLNFVNNFAVISQEMLEDIEEVVKTSKGVTLTEEKSGEVMETVADLRRNLGKIHGHGKRADDIVQSMLLHSHRQAMVKPVETDINELLQKFSNLAYHSMRAKSPIQVSLKTTFAELPLIQAVPQNLGRVFLNVVDNGFDSLRQKRAELGESFPARLEVSTRDMGDYVGVVIYDNGVGISDKVVDQVFNPFFTTKPAGEGTGLGLSISYDIVVKEHQGRIKVNTEPGEFTEFVIQLPKKLYKPDAV